MFNVFNDNETKTEIRYIIAYFERGSWYSYMFYENIEEAKKDLERFKRTKSKEFELFEYVRTATINQLHVDSISKTN